MPTPEKESQVAEIRERLSRARAVVLTDYRGLNVGEISDLRGRLRKAGAEYRVVKNTLVEIAAESLGLPSLEQYLAGPTAAAFSPCNSRTKRATSRSRSPTRNSDPPSSANPCWRGWTAKTLRPSSPKPSSLP